MQQRGDIPWDMTSVLVTQFFNQGRAATVVSGPWFIGEDRPRRSLRRRPAADRHRDRPRRRLRLQRSRPPTSAPARVGRRRAPSSSAISSAKRRRYCRRVGRQSVTTLAVWQHGDVQRDPVLRGFTPSWPISCFSPTHPAMRSFWEPGEQALRQSCAASSWFRPWRRRSSSWSVP